MHKIIIRDNFARDYNGGKSERLVAENIGNAAEAKTMADALNEKYGSAHSDYWAVVVDQSEPLYVFDGY